MKPRLAALFACLILFLSALPDRAQTEGRPQDLRSIDLHIDQATLHTQVAATDREQEIGLMFVKKMADNDGMVFLLPRVGPATFWMKNTLIPLSVAYIDRKGVILEIHDMQPADPTVPDQNLPLTRSESNQVAYALEANQHWFALNGIKSGDKISPSPETWTAASAKP